METPTNDRIKTLNEKIYSMGKFGVCANAERLHELLNKIASEIAVSEDPIERKTLLELFQLHLPSPMLLDQGLS